MVIIAASHAAYRGSSPRIGNKYFCITHSKVIINHGDRGIAHAEFLDFCSRQEPPRKNMLSQMKCRGVGGRSPRSVDFCFYSFVAAILTGKRHVSLALGCLVSHRFDCDAVSSKL